jgi:two-component system sensor histidine kinase LytS
VCMEKDPFVPPPPAQDGKRRLSGIGLSNVRSRLQAIYGQPYGIVIDSKKGLGTTCLIELPLGVKVHAESVHRG